MTNYLNEITQKAGKAIRHWWLLLLSGILTIAVGIIVFCRPLESYVTLSILFGVLMLVNGIIELVVSASSRNYFAMRGYAIVGGILDLLLGIFLCFYPQMTLILLPVFLGIWMMYHSFMMIGFGADLSSFHVDGAGWTIAGGILLLLMSILVLVMPLTVGVASVIVLTGTALILLGVMLVAVSIRFRKIHRYFKFDDAEVVK